MPGVAETAGPVLRQAIRDVADGASCLGKLFACIFDFKCKSNPPGSKAPAKVIATKTRALAAEHGKRFAKSTMRSFGVNVKNVPRWTSH